MYSRSFELRVGRFIAGQVERELRSGAFTCNIDIDIRKYMGWFNGILLVTIRGKDAERLDLFYEAVENFVKRINK